MPLRIEFTPKIDDLESAMENIAALKKPIGDHGPVDLVRVGGEATVDYKGAGPGGDYKFALGVKGNAGISVFNAANDEDPDGVFGGEPEKETVREKKNGKFGPVKMPPTLPYATGSAWSNIRFEATPLITGSIDFPLGFNLKLDASKSVVFGDYHRHTAGERTFDALSADLQNLRFAAEPNHIRNLPVGDALFYNVRGVLDSTLTFSWSDTFGVAVADLSRFLGPGQNLALDFGASVTVNLRFALHDDFRIAFTKEKTGHVRVAVLKSKSQELGIGIEAGLKIGFANADQLSEVVTTFLKGLIGPVTNPVANIIDKVDQIFAKASFDQLTGPEKELVKQIAIRLGLGSILDTIDEIKARWEGIKQKWNEIVNLVPDLVAKAIKMKVAIGFKYEYLRLNTDEELAVARLSPASLSAAHRDLLLLSLDRVLDESQKAGNELVTYLHQLTRLRRQSWGFTFGIGKWTLLSSNDTREVKVIEQRNIKKDRRIAFDTVRSFSEASLNESHRWVVDLKAEMGEFGQTLDYRKLDYGLSISQYSLEKKMSRKELRSYLDYAVLWHCLSVEGIDQQLEVFSKYLGSKCEITTELTFGDRALRDVIRLINEMNEGERDDRMVAAFARALPYTENMARFRSTPETRRQVYSSLWKWCFENPSVSLKDLRATVFNTLKVIDFTTASLEQDGAQEPDFVNQVRMNSYNSARAGFLKGCGRLDRLFNSSVSSDWDYDEFIDAYKSLRDLWSRRLYVRACGAFLLDVASKDPNLYRSITRAVTLSFKGDEDRTFVISSSNGLA